MENNNIKTEGVKAPSVKLVKLKALVHLAGVYKLAWSKGQEFEIDEIQAKELIDQKAAVKIK